MTPPIDPLVLVRAASRDAGDGIYLGYGTAGPVWAASQRMVLVLGPPRSGKTSAIVVPNVLAAAGPVVSTSTKPDVMSRTARSRSRTGETLLFDPTGTVLRPSGVGPLRWSPVQACSQWDQALLMARGMTAVSTDGAQRSMSSNPDHWHERAQALLAALLHAAALDSESMSTVLRWVDRRLTGPAQSILDGGGNALAADLLGGIAMTDARELSGIWSTASGVLSAYHSDAAMATTKGEAFDARQWCETNGTIYVCAPGRNQSLVAPLVVGLLTEIREARYASANEMLSTRDADWHVDRQKEHSDPTEASSAPPPSRAPLLLALDEAANIAPLSDLPVMLSEGGSQGVLMLVCLQDMSQARMRWGPEADGWLSLFGAKVVLPGIEDVKTLEMLSSLAGEEEVVTRSVTSSSAPRGDPLHSLVGWLGGARSRPSVTPPPTITTSTIRRPRMPVDELSRGAKGMALVVDERTEMGYVKLTRWFDHDLWHSVVDAGHRVHTRSRSILGPEGPGRGHPGPG